MISRSDYKSGKATHNEYYGQFVTKGVLGLVKDRIGEDRIKASEDPHFNDIPLAEWDRLPLWSHLASVIREANGNINPSLAEKNSVMKAAARMIKAGK